MLLFPNVKINLGLYITNRRNDGYHDLLTSFYPISWCDVLEVTPSSSFEFVQTGTQIPGKAEENLCVKAFKLLETELGIAPLRIHLHKVLPMGSGLGGGSSDATYVLKGLNEQCKLGLTEEQLEKYASQLGSDCAFFVKNKPAIGRSRGEHLEEIILDLKGNHIVIVCPELHVSTADAFAAVRPATFSGDFNALLFHQDKWKEQLHNQFEDSIFPKFPILAKIKDDLYKAGAWYASMSGSGSAIYGLFKNEFLGGFGGYKTFRGVL